MRKIPKASYDDVEQIKQRIDALLQEAGSLPPGMGRQSVLIEAARFQAYADIKNWASVPAQKMPPVDKRKSSTPAPKPKRSARI